MPYQDPDPAFDPASIEAEIVGQLEEAFGEWFPPTGSQAYRQIKIFARLHSITRGMSREDRAAKYRSFGEKIIGIAPIQAAPATVASTWTLTDDDGHTIPGGTTKVNIATSDGRVEGFEVVSDVEVPAGKAATEPGEVILRAVKPGTGANGLSAEPALISGLSFVLVPGGVALESVTANGVDAETEDEYLDRLTDDGLQLLSLSLVEEGDLAKDALSVPGIARCLVIGGYDPETKAEDVPLIACDFPVDAAGANLSAERKAELAARQNAKAPSGTKVFVADPTRTAVGVKTQVAVLPGFEPAAVLAAVKARLGEYLSPARWGAEGNQGESPAGAWKNATHVYYFELISVVDRVPGVDRVVSLESKKGGGGFAKVDIELAGPAPLAEPGALEVSAA